MIQASDELLKRELYTEKFTILVTKCLSHLRKGNIFITKDILVKISKMSVVDMLKISFQKNINCLAVKANFDELGIFIKPEVRNMC